MELIHTSAPRGLRPGTHGFCTVAATQGMPTDLMNRLESMSGFKQALDAAEPRPRAVFSHVVLSVGGVPMHLLSRIGPAPADYSGRTNRIAHHVMLSEAECPAAGPAAFLASEGIFEENWTGEPRTINRRLKANLEPVLPRPCEAWAALCGDAGWAGRVLEAVFDRGPGPLYVLVPSKADPLVLMSEVVALLPEARRWEATFTSLFQGDASPDVRCKIRFVPGTPDGLRMVKGSFGAQSLDLSAVAALPPPTGPAAEAARAGTTYGPPQPAGPRRLAPPPPIVVESPARSPLALDDTGESTTLPRRRSPQPIDTPERSIARILLVGACLLIVGATGGALLTWILTRPHTDPSMASQSQQAAPETPVKAETPGGVKPPITQQPSTKAATTNDEKSPSTEQMETLDKELQETKAQRDQHKAAADFAQQALREVSKPPPPQTPEFATKSGAGLEAIPETEVASYSVRSTVDSFDKLLEPSLRPAPRVNDVYKTRSVDAPAQSGYYRYRGVNHRDKTSWEIFQEVVSIDTKEFSLAGVVRYSLAKEAALRVARVGEQLRVSATSGVNGNERIIGWLAISNADGAFRLTWRRDESDLTKHEDFVLVLRNEQEQILKVRVKGPEQ